MASFGEGFASGIQLGKMFRERQLERSIDDAGKSVTEEMQKEKDFKTQQRQLVDNSKPVDTMSAEPVNPSVYQQNDSLGLRGYQTGNKPIETTVPTAPAGYGTREDGTTTDQTLLGNYGTTEAFKGEKPTLEDTRMMQKDLQRPFNGPQDNNVVDLAQIKPETPAQEIAKPKILNTLNETVTAADRAKEAYDYNTRVIQKLQQSGNARAALEYGSKVATSELTLAQADHMKFTTVVALSKHVGDMASNALESMQQPGADINKIYLDTLTSAKEDLGYTGKLPFSLDPRENIKTLQMLQKNSLTTTEKAEFGIKQAVASQKSVMDNAELTIKQEKLNLDKISTSLAIGKEGREQATASFTRLAENVKLQFQALNSINSVMDEDYKKALKPSYDANLKALQGYAKVLNVPMPNIAVGTPGNPFASNKTQPGAAPVAAPAVVNPSPNNQPVNNAFPADVLQDAGVASEAGGYVPPTPKTSAQVAQESTNKATKIKELKATIESAQKALNPGMETASDIERRGQLRVKAQQNRDAIKELLTGKKKRQALEESLLKAQKELDELTKS